MSVLDTRYPGWEAATKNRGYLACYGDNSYLFTIHFVAPGVPVAAPRYVPDQKAGSITVSVEEMPLYIDLVRNENRSTLTWIVSTHTRIELR